MVKRRTDGIASSPSPEPKVYLRLRKNVAGEWRVIRRSEGDRRRASNSAEDVIGLNPAWKDRPTTSSDLLRTPELAPLPGDLANGQPDSGLPLSAGTACSVTFKSILKSRSQSISQSESSSSLDKSPEKKVRIISDPDIKYITSLEDSSPSLLVSRPPPSGHELEIVPLGSPSPEMAEGRPKLKLSLTNKSNISQDPGSTPSSAVARTPSIKINFKAKETPTQALKTSRDVSPEFSTKKRKRTLSAKAIEADASSSPEPSFKKPPAPIRRPTKITLKQKPAPAQAPAQTPTSALIPSLKLKYKGKLPRRPIGVGYDSENEEAERDPVILEGFILRMQPGPDAEYVRKAITDGMVGLPRASGGADIQVRLFDTHGRRGVVVVRQQRYAASLVDLPCIVEGMKSWDRKGWIKSVDVCQMLLVLGKVGTDEQARQYPLPPDVDQKTWQYAHGLTAPMRWVRKRRFNRTKRARVDDIEAVERRVRALLEADEMAQSTRYELFDHDPREDNEPGEESGEYESGSGEEEGSDDLQATSPPQDYFAGQNGQHGGALESPKYEVDDEDVADLEAMLDASDNEDDDDSRLPAPQLNRIKDSLHAPEDGSSLAVTSTSGSPSAAAATPASVEDDEDSGDEASDEDDEEGSADEAEEEGDENRQQALDRIEDMKKKILEQTEVMKASENLILKRKIAAKITGLRADVEQMRRAAGLESEEED